MNRLFTRHLFVMLILLLALPALACGALGLGATATPEPTVTPLPTDTPAATNTPEPTATPAATATMEPTPTAEIDANFVEYESGVNGVSFSYPGEWSILDLFVLAIASDEALLEDTTGVEDGALMVIFAGDSDEAPSDNPAELVEEAVTELDFEEVTLVDGPTVTEIQGQPATLATFEAVAEDGTPLTIRLAVIVNGPRTGVATGITPTGVADNYLPTIDAVINTIVIFEPTEEDPFGDIIGDDFTPGEAIPIGPGESAAGAVVEGGFQDYQFQGLAGAPVVIALQPESEFDIEMAVFPVGDEESLLADVDDGFSSEAEVLVFTPDEDGDYSVRVSGFAGAAGDYVLVMFDPSQGITLEGAVADDEVAGFRVCVPVGEPLIAVVFADEDFDPVLNLTDPAGEQLVDEVDNGASGDPEVIFYTGGMDTFTEDYAVIVNLEGFAGFGGAYTLYIGPAGVVQDGC